jgi:hypothetical protein
MRILIATGAAALLLTGAAHAKDMKSCAAEWKAAKAAGATGSQTYKQFSATCMGAGAKGAAAVPPPSAQAAAASPPGKMTPNAGVASATSAAAPAGATAQCKDGTFSMSAHHSGTCSRHGGVAKFLK